jgi:hypothetical protein
MLGGAGFRVKASVLRAYARYLQREKVLAAVVARAAPVTGDLLRDPPLPSTWIEGGVFLDVQLALEAEQGPEGVMRMAELSVRDALPRFTGAVVGLLRIFGASPATLFSHLGQLVSSSVEGADYQYQPTGPRAGVVTISYPGARQLPACSFYSVLPTLRIILELCQVKDGQVGSPQLRGPNGAAYAVRW